MVMACANWLLESLPGCIYCCCCCDEDCFLLLLFGFDEETAPFMVSWIWLGEIS